jgi:hypothetical protein
MSPLAAMSASVGLIKRHCPLARTYLNLLQRGEVYAKRAKFSEADQIGGHKRPDPDPLKAVPRKKCQSAATHVSLAYGGHIHSRTGLAE